MASDEYRRRATESAERDVANWPEWKRNPPTVPMPDEPQAESGRLLEILQAISPPDEHGNGIDWAGRIERVRQEAASKAVAEAIGFLRKRLVGTPPNVDSEDVWMASVLDEAAALIASERKP